LPPRRDTTGCLYSEAQATLLVFAESSENLIAADARAQYGRFSVGDPTRIPVDLDQTRQLAASCLTAAWPGSDSDVAHASGWDALRNLSRSAIVGRGRSAGLGDAGVPLAATFSSQMNSTVLKLMFLSLFRWENFNQLVVHELVLAEQLKRVEAGRWDYRPQGVGSQHSAERIIKDHQVVRRGIHPLARRRSNNIHARVNFPCRPVNHAAKINWANWCGNGPAALLLVERLCSVIAPSSGRTVRSSPTNTALRIGSNCVLLVSIRQLLYTIGTNFLGPLCRFSRSACLRFRPS
jgi:hypothetical protein